MTCILELNDADLTLYRDRTVLHRSPGVAVVLNDEVHFGDDALKLARVHPRQTNQQYMSRLSGDPLAVPGSRARNHADLVYLHLKTFKPLIDAEGGAVLLAVPGVLSADQLGVLLGVLQEVGIEVRGFVDAAVAALANEAVAGPAYHVDVMMQRAVVTAVEADGQVGKAGAQEVPDCGLNRLLEGWINVIADRFVQETRFDPLHAAATEQQVFNQVYRWLDAGDGARDLTVEVVHADQARRVELGHAVLADKAEQRFRQLADVLPRGARAYLSARAARLPGLSQALAAAQAEVTALAADALVEGCLANLERIVPEGDELRLVTRLPLTSGGPAPAAPAETPPAAGSAAMNESPAQSRRAPPAAEPALAPTHLLHGSEAIPLEAGPTELALGRDGERFVLSPAADVRLNDTSPAEPAPLAVGDRISAGGREYRVIHVHGAAGPGGRGH